MKYVCPDIFCSETLNMTMQDGRTTVRCEFELMFATDDMNNWWKQAHPQVHLYAKAILEMIDTPLFKLARSYHSGYLVKSEATLLSKFLT